MPDTKISALTAGDPALSTDALPIARSGANYQVTAASVSGLVNRLAVITASGTPVVLTASSAPVSAVSGSGGQVIQLPNATTLTVGTIFRFDNNQTSGAITVNNNSGTLVVSVPSGGYVFVTLQTNGTAAGTWDRHDQAPANVSWSTNTLDYAGSITSATWNGVTVATNRGGTGLTAFTSGGAVYATSTSALATGTLPATAGGTGQASYAVGDLVYASTTTALSALADVATGNALISGGVGVAPSYGKIGLTTHVSGTLPTANGGTNLTTFTSGGALYATSTSALTTGTLPATAGGTGNASYAVGDLVYASTTTALSKLADVATGNALISGGIGVAPSYGKIGLTTHVSGTLPIANGGTGQTTASTAFNALSPVTTTGDLIIGNGSNSSTRLPIGTNAYVLTSNGTTASWQPAGGGGGSLLGVTDSTSPDRTFLGFDAGNGANADSSTFIGVSAGGASSSSSSYNVAVGAYSMLTASTAQYCVVLGYQAATNGSLGSYNTAIGATAYASGSGTNVTAIGNNALNSPVAANYDVAIGNNSSTSHSFSASAYNTVIGSEAGTSNSMGSYNVLIGYNAQPESYNADGGIVIGDTTNITKFSIPSIGVKAEYTSTDSFVRKSRFRSYAYNDGSQSMQFVSGSQQLDLGQNTSFNLYLTGSTSISLTATSSDSGTSQTFLLFLYSNGNSVSWSFSVYWPGGITPTLSATGTDLFVFRRDNGTGQVYGAKAGTF